MMARAIYNFCSERNIKFFGMVPNKHEESYIDEVLSYIFAAGGFYFQFKIGFDMPFPFNLLLWPLGTLLENVLATDVLTFGFLITSHSYLFLQNWASTISGGPLRRLARAFVRGRS